MNSRHILVTGGLGFIGSHLCQDLLRDEPDVRLTVVDNLSSPAVDAQFFERRAHVVIQDLLTFEPGIDHYDEIYHLASPVGSLRILERNGYVGRDILLLTHKAADLARACRSNLLFVSSSEIYSGDGVHAEDSVQPVQDKRGTRVEYALGKLLSEHVLFNLATDQSFRVKVCRPFNVIGPRQCSRTGFVVPTFFERALAGDDLPVFYDGAQQRSFCDVTDVVAALRAVQAHGRAGEVYNIGNPDNSITIKALAQTIVDLCNSRSKIANVDPQKLYGSQYIEAFARIPTIEKLRADTGWKPRLSLREALLRILSHYRVGPAPPGNSKGSDADPGGLSFSRRPD